MIVGPIQFDAPSYLLLAPVLWAIIWLLARKSLSGLGPVTRRVALVSRFLLVALIAGALAEPHWRREAEHVAVIVVTDTSRSMPPGDERALREYLTMATAGAENTDRLGLVTAAEQAYVQARPADAKPPAQAAQELTPDQWFVGPADGTDLQSGVEIAIALLSDDAAGRILLHSDGNETSGSLLASANAAKAAGIPIDVLPLAYKIEREVVFERLITPATGRRGQTINVRMVIEATEATRGRLTLMQDGEAIDLTPGEEGVSTIAELDAGRNVLTVPVTLTRNGPLQYEAIFEPLEPDGDVIRENNRAMGVTFVRGQGRILAYTRNAAIFEPIRRALVGAGSDVEVRPPENGHESIVELQRYDAVILADVPSYSFSQRQMDELVSYVHDNGGGLVMVGGPNAFGAGGWIGTPVANALPVLLDPPDKRQLPRGALVLIMHSIEMPKGTYWGKQVALAAAENLSRLDLIGVVEWSFSRRTWWPYDLSLKGDGTAVASAINNLSFGDMPDFSPTMRATQQALASAEAGQKHAIIISDGDPMPPSRALLQSFRDENISISTVCVFPHGGGMGGNDTRTMRLIAESTGGTFYFVNTQAQLAQLPDIFVKEAQVVRRSMIREGETVTPQVVNSAVPTMRGFGGTLPTITGYVVTAERQGLAQTTTKAPNGDPITAQWQHGLGRTVAITTDATSRWSESWLGWGGFEALINQHLRWAMRPSGSANVRVDTETRGDRTNVIVTALNEAGESLNFADFVGRVTGPDLESERLALRQTGPGRYEASFPTDESGSYLLSLRYESRNEAGEVTDRGFVQSAVTRSFSDEFRSIEDNTPLLAQVADITGGRVLSNDPALSDLFTRDGISMPVALRPVWLVFAVISLGVFLVDVAVRRVRIDIPAIARKVAGLFGRSEGRKASDVGALRQARERTRESFEQGEKESVADRKFEVQEGATADESTIVDTPGKKKTDAPIRTTKREETEGDEEEGMSRLMRAKRRARDTYKEDDDAEQRDGKNE